MKVLKKIINNFFNAILSIPRILFINFYRIFVVRIKVFNKKRIPKDRSLIFAFNHTTGADTIIVLGALRKKIYFLAGSDRFKNKFSSFFMRKFANSIPIFKKEFIKNFKSFKELFRISKEKKVFFGIFPEGHLNKSTVIKKIHSGTAYLSYKTKLPIVPVYIHNLSTGLNPRSSLGKKPVWEGIFSLFFNAFRKVNVFVGEPIEPVAENIIIEFKDFKNKKSYKEFVNAINNTIREQFIKLQSEADILIEDKTEMDLEKNKENKLNPESLTADSLLDSLEDKKLAEN